MATLATTHLGDAGSPVALCHGLFGQGKNWTTIAKSLAASHRVTLVDLPNHGDSPHTDDMDYEDMADSIATVLDTPSALVGHSMGGKAAMLTALRHPDAVSRLVVVDVAPTKYRSADEFQELIDAMLAIDLDTLASRADADAALSATVESTSLRGFLLQSLRREQGGWRWQLNLPVLRAGLGEVRGWPDIDAVYEGPVLWVGGSESGYVRDEHAAAMERLFPRVRRVTVKGAGHWVHSEQPAVMTAILERFLAG